MTRVAILTILPAGLVLGGCVAAMAASAVGMAAGGGRERQHRNVEFMIVAARQACSAHAAQYGTVAITDIKEAEGNEIIISGTATGANGKNSFKCSFVTEITAFDLQPIQPET